jgi:hypothetical protein
MQVRGGPVVSRGRYRSMVLQDNPVGYWPLSETAGNFLDVTANGNNGTPAGNLTRGVSPGPISGDSTACVQEIDLTGRISFADIATLKPATFTLEAWIKSIVVGTTFDTPLGNCSSNAFSDGYGFMYRTGLGLGFWTSKYDGAAGHGFMAYDNNQYTNDGLWHHYVGTYDGPSFTTSLYRDGSLQSSGISIAMVYAASTLAFFTFNANWPINSPLGQIAIYNYVLTPGQIQQHYLLGKSALIQV